MLTTDRDGYASDLRAYLGSLDHAALRRIADAPPEKWTAWAYCDPTGCRCLLGHAEGWRYGVGGAAPEGQTLGGHSAGEEAFHALVEADGLERTVASIRHYAAHLLGTRLRALLGEEVPACP